MENYEWNAWSVAYNSQSDMYDVYSTRKDGEETRVHSSWKDILDAQKTACRLNGGEQI